MEFSCGEWYNEESSQTVSVSTFNCHCQLTFCYQLLLVGVMFVKYQYERHLIMSRGSVITRIDDNLFIIIV